MTGKHFGVAPPATLRALGLALAAVAVAGPAGGCRRGQPTMTRPAAAVDAAVRPERLVQAFRRLGRAHLRGYARFAAAPDGTPMEWVTTETDVWIDDRGNWRLVETNDKDGGREVVLHGRELSVALRYGKMIRRPAEDPEPQRLLEEALGAPWAAWDLLRDVAAVDDFGRETVAGRSAHVYKLAKARRPPEPTRTVDPQDRRAWRRTIAVDQIEGTIIVDDGTGLPLSTNFRARYAMRRSGPGAGIPMHGQLEVRTSIEEIGSSPLIVPPEAAEDLPLRQRTVPEEKALIGGLARAEPPPPEAKPDAKSDRRPNRKVDGRRDKKPEKVR